MRSSCTVSEIIYRKTLGVRHSQVLSNAVGNVMWEVGPDAVYSILAEAGPVVDFVLRADTTGQHPHRGFGHVVYPTEQDAQRALQVCDQRQIMGRGIKVGHPEPIAPPVFTGMLGQGIRPAQLAAAAANQTPALTMPMQQNSTATMTGGQAGTAQSQLPSSSLANASQATSAPPSIRAALEAMGPGELWAILSELKTMAATQPEAAKALLMQYPMLAHAVVHIQAMLGTLSTPTPAYAAAVYASGGGASGEGQGQAGQGGEAVDEEQKALVKRVLAMSEVEVAAMPAEQREGVEQIRTALCMPVEKLEAMESPAREELLQLREQLMSVLAAF